MKDNQPLAHGMLTCHSNSCPKSNGFRQQKLNINYPIPSKKDDYQSNRLNNISLRLLFEQRLAQLCCNLSHFIHLYPCFLPSSKTQLNPSICSWLSSWLAKLPAIHCKAINNLLVADFAL